MKMDTGKNNETKYRRLFAGLVAGVLTVMVLLIALVVYVDPFFHYHRPLQGFPYIVDNQLSQNPGMTQNMDYNACIIGSSMTVNFDTDDFKELMGLDTLKLSYSGAYPKDDYNILSIVFITFTGLSPTVVSSDVIVASTRKYAAVATSDISARVGNSE